MVREQPEFNGDETIVEAVIPALQMAKWFTPESKPEQGEWVWWTFGLWHSILEGRGQHGAFFVALFHFWIDTNCSRRKHRRGRPAYCEGCPVGTARVVVFQN